MFQTLLHWVAALIFDSLDLHELVMKVKCKNNNNTRSKLERKKSSEQKASKPSNKIGKPSCLELVDETLFQFRCYLRSCTFLEHAIQFACRIGFYCVPLTSIGAFTFAVGTGATTGLIIVAPIGVLFVNLLRMFLLFRGFIHVKEISFCVIYYTDPE